SRPPLPPAPPPPRRVPAHPPPPARRGPRVELLDAHDGDVSRTLLLPSRQVVVDLPGAEQHPPHRGRIGDAGVVERLAEAAVDEIADGRGGARIAQQALRREDHERCAETPARLAAQ